MSGSNAEGVAPCLICSSAKPRRMAQALVVPKALEGSTIRTSHSLSMAAWRVAAIEFISTMILVAPPGGTKCFAPPRTHRSILGFADAKAGKVKLVNAICLFSYAGAYNTAGATVYCFKRLGLAALK